MICKLTNVTRLKQVAAQVLGCEPVELTEERYESYGLKVYSYAGLEYAIGSTGSSQAIYRGFSLEL